MGISVEIFREKKKEKQDTNTLSGFFWLFNELYWKTFFKEPWENVENLDFHRKMALKMKWLLIKQKQLFKTDK